MDKNGLNQAIRNVFGSKKTKMDRLQNWTKLDSFGAVFHLSDIKDSEVC